ncbi:Bug family tripartite tricarboxylate transporter substrate binding protein [Humitalea sp. 24SJ18S-53]|uniref:Bug family tripartite tricarboxylate transporter substrate binding protein n=1 Tax=Humitalea sp. 24SJ18S-53 TaxID=3422307 RepID=UPI003D668CC6
MKRLFLGIAALLPLMTCLSDGARAQAYPTRPVRMVLGFPPGGSTDIIARYVAEALSATWSVPVVVENRGGAGGNIASELVARSAPDGYTLLMIIGAHVTNRALHNNLPYDPIRDFAPVSLVTSTPIVLVANPQFEARTLADVLRLARARPNEIGYATAGVGSTQHLAAEFIARTQNLPWLHVSYRGGAPALNDTVAGVVPLAFLSTTQVAPMVSAGRLRGIAVATPARSPLMPEVPTFAESGMPNVTAETWYGVIAPAGTPEPIIQRIHADIARALDTPAMRERFASQDATIINGTPAELGTLMREEDVKWSALIRQLGIRAE